MEVYTVSLLIGLFELHPATTGVGDVKGRTHSEFRIGSLAGYFKDCEWNEDLSSTDVSVGLHRRIEPLAISLMNNVQSEIRQHGFAILPGIFSHQEMDKLSNEIEQSALKRSKAGIRHALQNDAVRKLAHDARLLELACDVVGGEAVPFRATLFDKSPEANWLVVWHQDTALPIRKWHDAQGWGPWSVKDGVTYAHAPASALSEVLSLRIHLDPSSASNGPLRVLPGTHVKGILTDGDIAQLAGQIHWIECLVPKGGVLAMKPLIVHSSSKSHSDTPRRVVHIEYATCKSFAQVSNLQLPRP